MLQLYFMRLTLLFVSLLLGIPTIQAQGYAFGIKGGLTVGFQRWDQSFQRDPLYRYHGILFVESLNDDNAFALFAQGGYHIKGSAIRTFATTYQIPSGGFERFPAFTIPFEFRNVSLTLGGKKKFDLGLSSKYYYLLGIRGDYTVSTKLRPDFIEPNNPYALLYPIDSYVNKFNYGITVGGGLEWLFSEYVGGVVEITVNPDFSKQYNQPRIDNIINPFPVGGSNITSIPERQINNLTIEITLGLRLLHKIIYLDE